MKEKVRAFIMKNQMIEAGDGIVLGLSGGADSVCLFFLLLSLKRELDFRLVCVHVHHGLRGSDADADETYVRNLCEAHGVAYRCFCYDVAKEARLQGCSEEEMGRILRYRSFEQALDEFSCNKIAVAHHMADQAETVLYHLCRGSGLDGLCGMRPISGNRIRPILCLKKEEILQYLTEQGIGWKEDRTNAELLYTRNRIRHRVLPCLEENVNTASVEHIADCAKALSEIAQYLEVQVSSAWESCAECGKEPAEVRFLLSRYRILDIVIKKQLIFRAIDVLKKGRKDIQAVHLAMVLELVDAQPGKEVCLPDGIRVVREYQELRFVCLKNGQWENRKREKQECDSLHLEHAGEYTLPDGTGWLTISEPIPVGEVPEKEIAKNAENVYTKWFDYDKIKDTLQLRTRKTGDYLMITEDGARKKLKSYFIDEKIPRQSRNAVWLLCDGSHILWVVGCRISEGCKIRENTKKAIRVEIKWR